MEPARESICKRCANKKICSSAMLEARNSYMTGCSRFEEAKPQTNADRIRGMSDEELAAWLEKIRLCCDNDLCGRSCPFAEVCYSNAEEPKETLDWLREEAET